MEIPLAIVREVVTTVPTSRGLVGTCKLVLAAGDGCPPDMDGVAARTSMLEWIRRDHG
jgi:hypothetical protein